RLVGPAEICARLTTAGVARLCSAADDGQAHPHVTFEIVGLNGYEGDISQYDSDAQFVKVANELKHITVAPDDYPNQDLEAQQQRTIITWGPANFAADAWDTCID